MPRRSQSVDQHIDWIIIRSLIPWYVRLQYSLVQVNLHDSEGPGIADGLNRFEPATCEEVLALLLKVDERKATGSDGIPCYVLRHCARVLAPSLTILMNASLAMGKVPMMLKLAHIRPIFKAGDPETAKNYRPISLLPVVSKILERIVHKRLCVLLRPRSHMHFFWRFRQSVTYASAVASATAEA